MSQAERRTPGKNVSILQPEGAAIVVPETGLIGAYLRSKQEAARQANVAHLLKDVINDRIEGLVEGFSAYLHEQFENEQPVIYTHPRVTRGGKYTKRKV